jgi:N,N-dimethylformamidase beta subunit-like protein
MATSTALTRIAPLVAVALLASGAALHHQHRADWRSGLDADELSLTGFAGSIPDSTKPKVTGFFPRQSYRAGDTALLEIDDRAADLRVQVFRAATSMKRIAASDVMTGSPAERTVDVGAVAGRRTIAVRLGADWPSGVYYAELTAPGDRIGYAPFVLRPRRLGAHDVAVVIPTQTWQAYNFRDDDGDGVPDTWYAGVGNTARLARPFLNRGVPPHYKQYDHRFLAWVNLTRSGADFISDAELESMSGAQLRKAYRLLVFEGHHEYVTTHEYDAVTRFRDLGGNLMFLTANNFYWKITIDRNVMTRVARWRDLGRPEAALIGVQFFHNDLGEHRGPWNVRPGATTVPWLLKGTGLRVGMLFSSGGIEADDVTPASPRGVRVIAAIPNLYGDGRNADMTYYSTRAGAHVFAAGAFTIAGSVWQGHVRELVSNLWAHLGSRA